LAIEIDGDSHYEVGAEEYDSMRVKYLQAFGVRVIRFTNTEVAQNLSEVVVRIREIILTSPNPSLEQEGS